MKRSKIKNNSILNSEMINLTLCSIKAGLVDAVFPPACPVCGQPAPFSKGKREQLCHTCSTKLLYINEPRCLKCGKEIDNQELEFCHDCLCHNHLYRQGTAVFAYSDAIKQSIYRFKYENKREYAGFYAKEIMKRCQETITGWKPDVIIPVPLHKSKYRKRGYNQSGLIAKELSALLKISMDESILIRSQNTIPMKELNNVQRVKNLENAFICTSDSVKYKKIILVDDIYTTGATIDACARVLIDAGAAEIFYVCLCIGKGF